MVYLISSLDFHFELLRYSDRDWRLLDLCFPSFMSLVITSIISMLFSLLVVNRLGECLEVPTIFC